MRRNTCRWHRQRHCGRRRAHGLLVRPLPLPHLDRLVSGYALREGFDPFGTSLLEYDAFKSRVASFERIGLARRQMSTAPAAMPCARRQPR